MICFLWHLGVEHDRDGLMRPREIHGLLVSLEGGMQEVDG